MGAAVKEPLVSVVTPLYNAGAFVEEAVASVKRQTYGNWELLVVDDCSSDGGADLVERLRAGDARISLVRLDRNRGAAYARNCGIEQAQGRYIAFLDADDRWLPDKLSRQVQFMQRTGAALSYTDYSTVSEGGAVLKPRNDPPQEVDYKMMLRSNFMGCLTVMYDAGVLGKMYMPDIRKRQDYGLWLSILKKVPCAHRVGDEPLALYTIRTGSMSSGKLRLVKYNWELFYKVERLSLVKSLYYVAWNIGIKLFK